VTTEIPLLTLKNKRKVVVGSKTKFAGTKASSPIRTRKKLVLATLDVATRPGSTARVLGSSMLAYVATTAVRVQHVILKQVAADLKGGSAEVHLKDD
jgi:hypothetical protein